MTSEVTPAPAPAAAAADTELPSQPQGDDGALTSAELAYFESGGEQTNGLAPDALKSDGPPDDGDDEKKPAQWVRHGAFHSERERRKTLEKELAAEREARARIDERTRLLAEVLTTPYAAGPEPAPDPETDIFAYARHLERKLGDVSAQFETRLNQVTGEVRRTAEQREADRDEAALNHAYASDAQRFMAANPDFAGAYRHLLQSRGQQLELLGNEPEKIPAMLLAEERSLVRQALARRQSPSEVIYHFARSFGYAPGAASTGAGAGRPAIADQIEQIKKGQDAGKSLSNAGGGAGNAFTPEMLANMPQHEFDTLYEKLKARGPGAVKALLGG